MNSLVSPTSPDTPLGASSIRPSAVCQRGKADVTDVGQDRLGDSEREAAIKLAGRLIVRYMARAEAGDYFYWRGLADRARLRQRELEAGRTNQQEPK